MRLDAVLSALHGVRRAGDGYVALCPAHADRNPSLSIREGKDRILLHCHAGCSFRAIVAALSAEPAIPLPCTSIPQPPLRPADDSARIEHARKLWREAKPLPGTPAQAYLEGRGIRLPSWPPTLRFHPACPHPSGTRLPALIAAVTTVTREGKLRLRGAHRIYLAPDGRKAAIEPRKAALGAVKGAAVYLSRPTATLAIGEGVEDALAVMVLCRHDPRFAGWSYAAAVSASNMSALELPPEVGTVIIAADNDEPGRKAAIKAAHRFIREGKDARIAYPPNAKDFAEELDAARECHAPADGPGANRP